jgi:hexosaminidase
VNLVPFPRWLRRHAGFFNLPIAGGIHFTAGADLPVALRLQEAIHRTGSNLTITAGSTIPANAVVVCRSRTGDFSGASSYELLISKSRITIEYGQSDDATQDGLRAGIATLRQLLREYGRRVPRLHIRDHGDFARRGVMLDISRGRVPRLETLLELVDHLSDLKINEFQLYTEHTFAYAKYRKVWEPWGALSGEEILKLDARCRELGIDLVPNQNSFGHLRHWLEYEPLQHLAETRKPWPLPSGQTVAWPFTLAPRHPGTMKFLRSLYDELLPYFSSRFFNVGCDETWDLGCGQSARLCQRFGKGNVYLRFLLNLHKEVTRRGKTIMFWGDIILQYPDLIGRLPRQNSCALDWGYEANHPFEKEAMQFEHTGIPFYVCPGTSTWMTLIGRLDNAEANLENAARSGLKHGAKGFLITDWGDGGHPQPLAVSYFPYAIGAGLAWCRQSFRRDAVKPMLERDVFENDTIADAAERLAYTHSKLNYRAFNCTPIGAALAAPLPSMGEMWCPDGLKHYARIDPRNLAAALGEIEIQVAKIARSKPDRPKAVSLTKELLLAGRMAAESCRYMIWQQAMSREKTARANAIAKRGIKELQNLECDLLEYWPLRNKATPAKCSPFLRWRIADYKKRRLHFSESESADIGPLSGS